MSEHRSQDSGEPPSPPSISRRVLWVGSSLVVGVAVPAAVLLILDETTTSAVFPGQATLRRQFDLDLGGNVATWVASVLALACAALSGLLVRIDRSRGRWWTGFTVVFAVLSLDEVSSLHREAMSVLRSVFGFRAFRSGWLAAVAVLAVLVGIFWPFVRRLSRTPRRWMLLGGIVFVSGGLGLDVAGGLYRRTVGSGTLGYSLLGMFEGVLELAGLALFAFALSVQIDMVLDRGGGRER